MARAAARSAHAPPVPGVRSRARGDLLDAAVSGHPDDGSRRGVSQSGAGRRANCGRHPGCRRCTGARAVAPRGSSGRGRGAHARSAPAGSCSSPSPAPTAASIYRYDDTNPEGRTARMIADRALQIASGRVDPVPVQDDVAREVGSRYIDFLVPGLVGMGIMSNAVWGLGFSIVDARRRKLMKRIIATPMRRMDYLLSFQIWRMFLLVFEVGVPVGVRHARIRRAGAWIDRRARGDLGAGLVRFQRARYCSSRRARGRSRPSPGS